MAWEIPFDKPEEEKKKTEPKFHSEWKPADHPDHLSFFDKLILLVATWHYFKYTGIAISKGKKIPREWMLLKNKLYKGKIQKELEKRFGADEKKIPQYKVVDIEKGTPVPLL